MEKNILIAGKDIPFCSDFAQQLLLSGCNVVAAGKTDYKIKFASQMWAARPHLANIFEKLLDQKTFYFACGS